VASASHSILVEGVDCAIGGGVDSLSLCQPAWIKGATKKIPPYRIYFTSLAHSNAIHSTRLSKLSYLWTVRECLKSMWWWWWYLLNALPLSVVSTCRRGHRAQAFEEPPCAMDAHDQHRWPRGGEKMYTCDNLFVCIDAYMNSFKIELSTAFYTNV